MNKNYQNISQGNIFSQLPDFVHQQPTLHQRENNSESESILKSQEKKLSAQCELVKKLLESGVRLTVRSAIIDYGINSLPRRILDLKQYHGMNIKSELINKNYKEYYI